MRRWALWAVIVAALAAALYVGVIIAMNVGIEFSLPKFSNWTTTVRSGQLAMRANSRMFRALAGALPKGAGA